MKKWIGLLFIFNLAVFAYFNVAGLSNKPSQPTAVSGNTNEIKLLSPTEIAALAEKPVVLSPADTPSAPIAK
ncbi:MAG: hypothetical protein LAC66_03470 [Methylotenera sp.]|nr:hypothetical protein [Methylotenera sp.]